MIMITYRRWVCLEISFRGNMMGAKDFEKGSPDSCLIPKLQRNLLINFVNLLWSRRRLGSGIRREEYACQIATIGQNISITGEWLSTYVPTYGCQTSLTIANISRVKLISFSGIL